MCGIAGFIGCPGVRNSDKMKENILRMTHVLFHRGPDDSGIWIDRDNGICFGHRRLSIIDRSASGHQPMESLSGRYIIVFNGEIYNFVEIKNKLEAETNYSWRGHSDTEVILEAVNRWGVNEALGHFNGMFAFALFDRLKRQLYLVRDRLGKKPLYYGQSGGVFLFASELKSIREHENFKPEIDRDALALYLRYNYVPAPYSIYRNIYKLTPGNMLVLDLGERGILNQRMVTYWSAKETGQAGADKPFSGTFDEALTRLEGLLADAVRLRLVSDVSVGAFLSGGVDSSLIVALMQAQNSARVKTFTIGLEEQGFNEAGFARQIAEYLHTEHTEFYVTAKETREVIPQLPDLYDEPFADSSQIPTFLVSRLTRQYVTVSLSGDGGDELFGGYNRYFIAPAIWNNVKWLPFTLRKGLAGIVQSITPAQWNIFSRIFSPALRRYGTQGTFADKFNKIAQVMNMPDSDAVYRRLVSVYDNPEEIILEGREPSTIVTDRSLWPKSPNFVRRMMYLDLVSYLPDDILVKVDRASMGVGLEARAPFLDHRVVKFSCCLPNKMLYNDSKGKLLLRKLLNKYVPAKLIERPKMGFGIPIDAWLRGPLKEWAGDLLNENKLQQDGFFRPKLIAKQFSEHISGKRNWQYCLWGILMFQAWKERWL